jgi:hypothetical protein
MIRIKKSKCRNCHTFFLPDSRNAKRQKFCGKPECREASKKESQRKWLNKPENNDHFRGPENVLRVQQWRAEHPGYWRRNKTQTKIALQDPLTCQPYEKIEDTSKLHEVALQDFLIAQPFVLLGLIANFTGGTLQDDIDTSIRRLQELGQDIAVHHINCNKGGYYGVKRSYPAPTGASCTAAVQLGGPSVGP